MKWLEMTIFVVFLWYPFNVKVGNVKEFAVECPSPGQSRWMACSGCSKSSGKLWFEAWIPPVTSSQLSDGVFLSPQQLVQSIKTNRSPNLVGTNFLNFLVCPRLIYNPKWDGMGGSKNDLRPGKQIFLCGLWELRKLESPKPISRFHFHHIPWSRWLETFVFVCFFWESSTTETSPLQAETSERLVWTSWCRALESCRDSRCKFEAKNGDPKFRFFFSVTQMTTFDAFSNISFFWGKKTQLLGKILLMVLMGSCWSL